MFASFFHRRGAGMSKGDLGPPRGRPLETVLPIYGPGAPPPRSAAALQMNETSPPVWDPRDGLPSKEEPAQEPAPEPVRRAELPSRGRPGPWADHWRDGAPIMTVVLDWNRRSSLVVPAVPARICV